MGREAETHARIKANIAAFERVMADGALDAIVVNAWLANDLQIKAGDTVDVDYFVMGPQLQLHTRSHQFRVRRVVPLAGVAADPSLMPGFPGLENTESCRDWEPGIPIDLGRIRDVDEDYWDEHRGTPKAFVGLAAGRRLFQNRYGSLTAVRGPRANAQRVT